MDVTPLTGSETTGLPMDQLPLYRGWLTSLSVMLELLRLMRRLHLTLDEPTRVRIQELIHTTLFHLYELDIPPYSLLPFVQKPDFRISLTVNPVASDPAVAPGMRLGRLRVLAHLLNNRRGQPIYGDLIGDVMERSYLELVATLRHNGFERVDLVTNFAHDHEAFAAAHGTDPEYAVINAIQAMPNDPIMRLLSGKLDDNPGLNLVRLCVMHGVRDFWEGVRIGMQQVQSAGSAVLARAYKLNAAQTEWLVEQILAKTNPLVLSIDIGDNTVDCVQPVAALDSVGCWHIQAGILAGRALGCAVLRDERQDSSYNLVIEDYNRRMRTCIRNALAEYIHRCVGELGAFDPAQHDDDTHTVASLLAQIGGSL